MTETMFYGVRKHQYISKTEKIVFGFSAHHKKNETKTVSNPLRKAHILQLCSRVVMQAGNEVALQFLNLMKN